jgi:hypothetical protein
MGHLEALVTLAKACNIDAKPTKKSHGAEGNAIFAVSFEGETSCRTASKCRTGSTTIATFSHLSPCSPLLSRIIPFRSAYLWFPRQSESSFTLSNSNMPPRAYKITLDQLRMAARVSWRHHNTPHFVATTSVHFSSSVLIVDFLTE